jgi:hypothetical protein
MDLTLKQLEAKLPKLRRVQSITLTVDTLNATSFDILDNKELLPALKSLSLVIGFAYHHDDTRNRTQMAKVANFVDSRPVEQITCGTYWLPFFSKVSHLKRLHLNHEMGTKDSLAPISKWTTLESISSERSPTEQQERIDITELNKVQFLDLRLVYKASEGQEKGHLALAAEVLKQKPSIKGVVAWTNHKQPWTDMLSVIQTFPDSRVERILTQARFVVPHSSLLIQPRTILDSLTDNANEESKVDLAPISSLFKMSYFDPLSIFRTSLVSDAGASPMRLALHPSQTSLLDLFRDYLNHNFNSTREALHARYGLVDHFALHEAAFRGLVVSATLFISLNLDGSKRFARKSTMKNSTSQSSPNALGWAVQGMNSGWLRINCRSIARAFIQAPLRSSKLTRI